MGDTIQKITIGYVVQEYDKKTGQPIGQRFVAGDQVDWTEDGEDINSPGGEGFPYLPFDMIQPDPQEKSRIFKFSQKGTPFTKDDAKHGFYGG